MATQTEAIQILEIRRTFSASRDRVFQPCFTSKRNGTGLGLALVQKIIVFHNGRVNIDRAASGGANFQITLPRAG